MKIVIDEGKQIKFPPIEFSITIEREVELAYLWGLFNTATGSIKDNAKCYPYMKNLLDANKLADIQMDLFRQIDSIASDRKLK